MPNSILNVLFLCTGNSARSIMAESCLNHAGHGKFRAFSAGSFPKGEVHPLALKTLRAAGHSVAGLRSKSWNEYERTSTLRMDLVITVCDNAASEICPFWPGAPGKAHWSFPDPAAYNGPEDAQWTRFSCIFGEIRSTIARFVALPLTSFDAATMSERVEELGPHRGQNSERVTGNNAS